MGGGNLFDVCELHVSPNADIHKKLTRTASSFCNAIL